MTSGDKAQPTAPKSPQPADVLRWVAASAPALWFPSRQAAELAMPRDSLDEPLWILRQMGLVQVADWVKGAGQGFKLTPQGEQAVRESGPLVVPKTPLPAPVVDADGILPAAAPGAEESTQELLSSPQPSMVAPALVVVNVIWFVIGGYVASRNGVPLGDYLKGEGTVLPASLMEIGALTVDSLFRQEWWRLGSCCFVHIGMLHLLCNMMMLGILCPVGEGLWGRWRFLTLYLISGLAGSAVAMALRPSIISPSGELRPVMLAGASGALWGVLSGLLIWLYAHRRDFSNDDVTDWLRRLSLVVFMGLLLSFLPNVSLEAHVGGGIAGMILVFALDRIRAGNSTRRLIVGVLGCGLVIWAIPASLYAAERWSESWSQFREREARRQELEHQRRLAEEADKLRQQEAQRLEEQAKRRVPILAVHRAAALVEERARAADFLLRTPKAIADIRQRIGVLRATLPAAEAVVWPDAELKARVQKYLATVGEFLKVVEERSSPQTKQDDAAAIAAAASAVAAAWNELGWTR